MRSSTTFIVFGVIIVAVLLLAGISSYTNRSHPAVRAANSFFTAIAKNDGETAARLVDSAAGTVLRAGSNISGIRFNEVVGYDGAFAARKSVLWTYLNLTDMHIDPKIPAEIADDGSLVTVTLTNTGRMYLHPVDGQWKVFYIAAPGDEAR